MTNEAQVLQLDEYRPEPTPLQLEADRRSLEAQQRRTDIVGAVAIGFITTLALCGLFLFVHALGWL